LGCDSRILATGALRNISIATKLLVDLDGTITHPAHGLIGAFRYALERLGVIGGNWDLMGVRHYRGDNAHTPSGHNHRFILRNVVTKASKLSVARPSRSRSS